MKLYRFDFVAMRVDREIGRSFLSHRANFIGDLADGGPNLSSSLSLRMSLRSVMQVNRTL